MRIIRKIPLRGKKTECQIVPCKNKDTYAVGLEGRRKSYWFVCEDHLRQIVKEGAEFLGIGFDADAAEHIKELVGRIRKLEAQLESGKPADDGSDESLEEAEAVSEVSGEEDGAEDDSPEDAVKPAPAEPTAPQDGSTAGEQPVPKVPRRPAKRRKTEK